MDSITNLGAQMLRKLGYIGDGIAKFKKGIVMYSEEPYGILFDLTPEMRKTVNMLKSRGLTVYAVIRGKYRMDDSSVMPSTTYLYLQ